MKLSKVVLRETGYDPQTEQSSVTNGRGEFSTADGYAIEANGEWVHVSHSGRTGVFWAGAVRHAIKAVIEPESVALPPGPVVEPKALTPQSTQGAQQKQWKGKR